MKVSAPAKKPAQPTSFMNWLGRQVGHVTSAVKTDVTQPAGTAGKGGGKQPAGAAAGRGPTKPAATARQATQPKAAAPTSAPGSGKAESAGAGGGVVVYRENKVEEAEMPDRPGVILRRTIIDEVVIDAESATPPRQPAPDGSPDRSRP